MISRVVDWNWLGLVVVLALFGIWNLEFIATLLDRRDEPAEIPARLKGAMDREILERGREYRTLAARFEIIRSSASLAVLLGFWFLSGFQWLDEWTRCIAGDGIVAGLLFVAVLFLAQMIFAFPFEVWDTFVLEEKFDFNKATARTFLMDRIKGLVLAAVLGGPLVAALLWILANVTNAWIWAWVVIGSFQVVMIWLGPSLIMPLFNRFEPMENGPLRDSIQELGEQCGFPVEDVYVMDGSKRSTKSNAFFTGIGKNRKIALYDTLIENSSESEILAVLAHEIGHFRCGHIRQRLVAGLLNLGVICFLLGICTDRDSAVAGLVFDAFGVAEVSPHVGLVLFGVLFSPVSSLLGIALHAWSRNHEFEADEYAARATGSSEELANALCKMSSDHLSHPTPSSLRVWLDYSHPPLLQRLEAMHRIGTGAD